MSGVIQRMSGVTLGILGDIQMIGEEVLPRLGSGLAREELASTS